ncbi:uncharacterized protein LOC143212383 isoform X2 [Lasioglossum baleicum]|uniref:uncharacterized protein LOC143212383 isoform X2 n=1 Tax=Lasioglossum baleicum TaxID=434251 RepID=UPI003FCC8FA5
MRDRADSCRAALSLALRHCQQLQHPGEIANCKGESFLVERCNNFSDIRPKSNKTRFSSVCTRNRRYNMSVPKIKIERSNSLRSLSHASYHLISAFREVSDLSLKVAGTMCNNRVYTEPSLRLFELG